MAILLKICIAFWDERILQLHYSNYRKGEKKVKHYCLKYQKKKRKRKKNWPVAQQLLKPDEKIDFIRSEVSSLYIWPEIVEPP